MHILLLCNVYAIRLGNLATATEAIGATELIPSLLGKTRDGTTREERTSMLDANSLNKDFWQWFLLWLIIFLSPPFRNEEFDDVVVL